MALLSFRKEHPEYDDMNDFDLATSLHQNYYSDMNIGEFMKEAGVEESTVQEHVASALVETLPLSAPKKKDGKVRPRWDELVDASARGLARMGSAGAQLKASLSYLGDDKWTQPVAPFSTHRKEQAKKDAAKWRGRAKFLWEVSKNPGLAAQNTDIASQALNLIGETLPYIAGISAATAATGLGGAFAVGSLVEGNSAYRTALDEGVPEAKAKQIGVGVGLISGAIESFGGGLAENLMIKATAKLKSKILKKGAIFTIGTVVEALEEGGQEIAQLTGEATYRKINVKNAVYRTLSSMAGGAFLGGAMKGTVAIVRGTEAKGVERAREIRESLMSPRQKAVMDKFNRDRAHIAIKHGIGAKARKLQDLRRQQAESDMNEAEEADLQDEFGVEEDIAPKSVTDAYMSLQEAMKPIPAIREGASQADIASIETATAERGPRIEKAFNTLVETQRSELQRASALAEEAQIKINEIAAKVEEVAFAENRLLSLRLRLSELSKPIPVRQQGKMLADVGSIDAFINSREGELTAIKLEIATVEKALSQAKVPDVAQESVNRARAAIADIVGPIARAKVIAPRPDEPETIKPDFAEERQVRELEKPDAVMRDTQLEARERFGDSELRMKVAETKLPTNPYLNMPISQVQEDAANGVKLAKEVLAEIDPAAYQGTKITTPANNEQKRVGHMLKDKARLSEEQYRTALKDSTGLDSMAKMNQEEADDAIRQLTMLRDSIKQTKVVAKTKRVEADPQTPPGFDNKIMRASGSDEVYNKTMLYSNKAGGVPSNPEVPNLDWRQERYAQDLINIGNVQRRAARRRAAREPIDRQTNLINQWSSARYAMAQAGVKSGVPLRKTYSDIVAKADAIRAQNTKALDAALHRAGAPKVGPPVSFQEGVQISNWLFENPETNPVTKQEYWDAMSEKTQKIATEIHGFLQNESATQVRWARWINWDRAARKADEQIRKLSDRKIKLTKARLKRIMKPVRLAMPINAPQSALEEGRAAQSIGQLPDWIETQTWGTRKHYFMSEGEMKELTQMYPTGSIPEDLETKAAEIGKAPEMIMPETMTREGKSKIAKGANLLSAVLNHANRVGTFAATYDDVQNFWTAFGSTNPSAGDIASVRRLVNTSLGFRHSVEPPIKVVRGLNVAFWRAYFGFSTTRMGWFAYRNLHQNIAYGLSQSEFKEAAKSSASLSKAVSHMASNRFSPESRLESLDAINPWIKEDYLSHWENRISQRKQMHYQFMLQKQGAIVSDFGGEAVSIIDALGSIAVYSDELNRLQAWPIMHQTAFRNTKKLLEGKITAKKFWTNLNMDTLHVDQRIEMHQLIDKGKWRELVNSYAEYKTENIHFRYETALRSVSEQTPTGQALMGLKVFPWGTGEILYQNGLKPFKQGFESGNYRQSYEGLKTIIMAIAGSRAARYLLFAATGRVAYGIVDTVFRYSPMSPGMKKAVDLLDITNEALYLSQENGWSKKRTFDTIVNSVVYQAEVFIPMCDVYLNMREGIEDDYGRRFYSDMKQLAEKQFTTRTEKRFRGANRSTTEFWQHVIFGGAEKGKEPTGRQLRKTRPIRKTR